MIYREHWYQVIKAKRKAKSLSQLDVAKALGIQRSRFSLIENGESYLNDIQLVKLLFLLDISPFEIIDPNQSIETGLIGFLHGAFQLVFKYRRNNSHELEQFINEQNAILKELLELEVPVNHGEKR